MAEPGLPGDSPPAPSLPDSDIAIPAGRAAADRDAVLDRDDDERDRDVDRLAGAAAAVGLADCIVLAAVMSAFAAEVIALVAVFIDCIADDIVRADAVAFVAAAVIFVAADVTLVAADVTPRAAVAGVVVLRPVVVRPEVVRPVVVRPVVVRPEVVRPDVVRPDVVRPVLARVPGLRLAGLRLVPALVRADVERDAVEREAVDRDAVLRVDRDAVVRGVALDAVLRADVAAELRPAIGVADDVPEPDADFDRLAVPRDALRLTGLLRAELAELRRVAARVVD